VAKEEFVAHHIDVLAAVERLMNEHGKVRARKVALFEQQKARRARSRKRFQFWASVVSHIGSERVQGLW
jgi:hypothetical protein